MSFYSCCLQSLFLIVALLLFLLPPPAAAAAAAAAPAPAPAPAPASADSINKSKFLECSPRTYQCGDNYTISYPFRMPDMPEYCGHPKLQLACISRNSQMLLVIHITGNEYYVQAIDYNNKLIHVSRLDLYSNDSSSCPPMRMFTNTNTNTDTNSWIDLPLFNFTTFDYSVTVYVNCSKALLPDLSPIDCLTNNSTGRYSYYSLSPHPPVDQFSGSCSFITEIPIYLVVLKYLETRAMDFVEAVRKGFELSWLAGQQWCDGCKHTGGVCGFDFSPLDSPTCFCPDGRTTTDTCLKAKKKHVETIIIAASVGGTAVLVAASCIVLCSFARMSWKENINNDQNFENFLKKHGSLAPKRYKYSDVKKITESFRNKLGQGGYGSVFKGNLSDGCLVAVKVLSDTKGNGEDFFNEIASIGRSSHVNIVNLLGFCWEGSKRALIYEYMCNGSLDKLISSEKPKTTLGWQKLYQIAIGIARGLEYLHRGSNTRIVHFDIKPHNILLDEDFFPKISDFGLSKLCLRKDSILSVEGTRGTAGYIAPEVFSRNFGVVSSKSDIYSYGMMVLEMAGGRENISLDVQNTSETYFPFSIYKHLDQIEGLQAYGATAETEEVVRKMILVGLWCIQTMPQNRPSITKVIEMLEGRIDDLQVPPKPYLSFPSLGPIEDILTIHDSCSNGGCSYALQ